MYLYNEYSAFEFKVINKQIRVSYPLFEKFVKKLFKNDHHTKQLW